MCSFSRFKNLELNCWTLQMSELSKLKHAEFKMSISIPYPGYFLSHSAPQKIFDMRLVELLTSTYFDLFDFVLILYSHLSVLHMCVLFFESLFELLSFVGITHNCSYLVHV
jgi:hypothetical protein